LVWRNLRLSFRKNVRKTVRKPPQPIASPLESMACGTFGAEEGTIAISAKLLEINGLSDF
jgi:hypothetical protein